jgi:hypothetical protein
VAREKEMDRKDLVTRLEELREESRRRKEKVEGKHDSGEEPGEVVVSKGVVVYLPLWSVHQRGIPNEVVRSALFSVGNRKMKRAYRDSSEITLIGKGQIRYRGEELRQDDEDVWLQVLHLARRQQLGEWVKFSAYGMLRELGWPPHGGSYRRLRECLERMQATTLSVYSERLKEGFSVSLIRKFRWKSEGRGRPERWQVFIEPEMRELFGDLHYTRIEWEQRTKLGPLAKWLHGLYASHVHPYPLKVETIRDGCGSQTRQLRFFKQKLKAALQELAAVDFLADWRIDADDVVHVLRKKPPDGSSKPLPEA